MPLPLPAGRFTRPDRLFGAAYAAASPWRFPFSPGIRCPGPDMEGEDRKKDRRRENERPIEDLTVHARIPLFFSRQPACPDSIKERAMSGKTE